MAKLNLGEPKSLDLEVQKWVGLCKNLTLGGLEYRIITLNLDMEEKPQKKKNLVSYLALTIGGATFGPMIVFGGIGFYLDKIYGTKPVYLLVGIGVAFIVSNILLVKKARYVSRLVKEGKI